MFIKAGVYARRNNPLVPIVDEEEMHLIPVNESTVNTITGNLYY